MSMTELISSYSSLNLLTLLFRRKPEKSVKKNLIPRNNKFAINLEFLALMEFVLTRVHVASELSGLTVPFYMFTDPRYLSDKEKCSLISKLLRSSKWHKISGDKNLVVSSPNKAPIVTEVEPTTLFNQGDVLLKGSEVGNIKILEATDILEKESETIERKCDCPSGFGSIVPSESSNPCNLNFSSSAESTIVSSQPKKSDVCNVEPETSDKSEDNIVQTNSPGKSNLEMYSSQLISIVKDVCELVKEMEERDEAIEVEDYFLDEDGSVFPKKDENSEEDHPLLDEGIYMNEDSSDDTKEIQEILGNAFSSKSETSDTKFWNKRFPRLVCDPPCSIWCDSAQETGNQKEFKEVAPLNAVRNSFGVPVRSFSADLYRPLTASKPLYKRSFSVNDSLQPKENLSTSSQFRGFDPVSREKLILLRKDPVTYFKVFGHGNRPSGRELDRRMSFPIQRSNSYMPDQHLPNQQWKKSTSDNCLDRTTGSGMWGPFDGEDSLWQPLPECMPVVDQIPKHNVYKRVRDLRRQKSLN